MELHRSEGLVSTSADVQDPRDRILLAALGCFVRRGYHGTTIREIASAAESSVPGLYHHFSSKLVLLETILSETMQDLVMLTANAVDEAGDDPVARISAVVMSHVRFHCVRPEESFVGNTELRSLSPSVLVDVMSYRDRQQRMFDSAVEDGVASGVFSVGRPAQASLAIASMCTAVSTWYRRDGGLDVEEIVEEYRRLALNTLAYRGA